MRLNKDNTYELSFGPVVSVSWLTLHNFDSLDINSVTFTAGLKFACRYYGNSFLILESGYKNIAGEHNFYFSVRLDNIFPVLTAAFLVNWPVLFLQFD